MDQSIIPTLVMRVEAGDDLNACGHLAAAARAHLAERIALPLSPPAD